MKMQNWLTARSAKLLEEINNIPYTDDSDQIKMGLIISAMRESSVEMFHRAAENSRKKIEKINSIAMQKSIMEVEAVMADDGEMLMKTKEVESKEEEEQPKQEKQDAKPEDPEKPEPKIKLSSSLIRRVDSF